MSRNVSIAIVVIALIVLGGWYVASRQPNAPVATPQPQVTTTSSPSASAATQSAVAREVKVSVVRTGFSPKDITLKAGDKVIWTNDDTINHNVNSSVHPTHLDYPPLNLGTLLPGESKSLVFPTAGTYKYHDHLHPSLTGTVTVE